ncbi:MAG: hypothetical protein JXB30_18735, partial [Anaerolineae bacterium]|nr:hypothetical protein [Anaerolineae bacterium]
MSQQNDYKWNDYTLTAREVGEIESPERLTDLFHRLRYHVDAAGHVDHMVLRLDSDDLRHQVTSLYKIATDPDNEEIEVYLLEVRSVTQALIQELTRRLRSLPKSYLLVLTQDYERLNFVLLERVLTERKTGTASILRPRVLTVDRRNPDAVSLRVLKRFTFTEADALYQWEKLRGAYALAEWSEQYFNNRALFSDYYLNERLTDQQITPAWAEDARPMGREVAGLMASAREKFSGKPEVTIRSELYEPLFELLGFEATVGKVGSSSADTPDYYLFLPGQDKPIALALTYVWNRNLDDHDTTRDSQTPTEIPGAMVVSFLERAEAPWVIVTNGKLWRLYSATAGNKATNYYEVDLEEALTAPDQVTAFKYWWLMFRREAFTGFLDELLAASVDYAKKLGDSLKSTVFESIFPYFAAGFIEDMRKQGVGEKDIETCLGLVYTGTLTFLYRLMFQLYAESLELLPVKELTGYGSWSLYLLKKQVAEAGGDALDAAPRKLAEHYSAESQELYDWLKWLFRLIDQGEPKINLPTYNGGLFSASTDEGQFLEQYAIPDRYLALGLDALCRAEDDKTHGLAMIDFKSLGVRQLGSIYEGLLEFRLHIAGEPLAVIREKKKEVYISEKEAQKRKKRVLKVLQPGDVYLENDKRERKATGSYYTPDYIVKYIVEHTVGPVLDRKFEALAPRLREAQKAYRHHTDTVKARGGDQSPELFWDTHEMRRLADDCLSVRVLDPAMGSGHFLVEVVDYVSNRLIDFLNAWGENPVWALLERTREDIIEEVQRQHVTVDFDRLTRVALLKRAVLKRCVYGVDLNPMAVELA